MWLDLSCCHRSGRRCFSKMNLCLSHSVIHRKKKIQKQKTNYLIIVMAHPTINVMCGNKRPYTFSFFNAFNFTQPLYRECAGWCNRPSKFKKSYNSFSTLLYNPRQRITWESMSHTSHTYASTHFYVSMSISKASASFQTCTYQHYPSYYTIHIHDEQPNCDPLMEEQQTSE